MVTFQKTFVHMRLNVPTSHHNMYIYIPHIGPEMNQQPSKL